MAQTLYDALVVGGGPAGLSMAAALARQVYSVLVLDSGEYRNARAAHMHTVPGFDHVPPAAYRAKIRDDLAARYPHVEVRVGVCVARVRKVPADTPTTTTTTGPGPGDVFEAVDTQGIVYRAKTLGLATGVRDVPPADVPGYDECWALGVFHCLFCHGFEERGAASVGVLAGGLLTGAPMIAHVALMAKRLAASTTIYTNGDAALAAAVRPLLHSSKIRLDDRRIARLQLLPSRPGGGGVAVHFADGSAAATEGFVANHPRVEARAPQLARQLALECAPDSDGGDIVVRGPFNETSLAGCFAAGDHATPFKSVVQAVQMGVFAGSGMCAALQGDLDRRDEI